MQWLIPGSNIYFQVDLDVVVNSGATIYFQVVLDGVVNSRGNHIFSGGP